MISFTGAGTGLTGTAASLTAGNVTTNANLTGDVTSAGNATTLATVNSNVGSFGSTTVVPVITVNGKGLITAVSTATIAGGGVTSVNSRTGAVTLALNDVPASYAAVAATGSTQGTATALTNDYNNVNSGTGGVTLPTLATGRIVIIKNNTASSINVWCNSAGGGTIDGAGNSSAWVINPQVTEIFIYTSSVNVNMVNRAVITGGFGYTTVFRDASGNINGNNLVASGQFTGAGTGLTGTASSLTVGNATTAVNITGTLAVSQGGTGATTNTGSGSAVLSTAASVSGMLISTTAAITAAGSTQGTATALTTDFNLVTTVAAATGVILQVGATGKQVTVVNKGANPLNVYPQTLSSIDLLSPNSPLVLAVNSMVTFVATSANNWYTTANEAMQVTDDTSTNATYYPLFAVSNTGTTLSKISSTKLNFNPSTGVLTSTSFTGAGTGLTGTAASLNIGGNAANVTGTIAVANGGTAATTAAQARINLGLQTGSTLSDILASGTTAQRDSSPAAGYTRLNTDKSQLEVYNGTAWVSSGAVGAGGNSVFFENDQTVTTSYTLTSNKNAMSTGPITINTGITVTIPTGARWVIL